MKTTVTRFIAAAVISTSFMMPVLASAQTASTTDDQIKTLMEQIKLLQQQLMTLMKARHSDTGTSTPPMMGGDSDGKRPCPAFVRDLRRGAQGDDVKALQEHLAQAMPDVFSDDKITGFFGPMTEKALMRFQDMTGIGTSTGVFGPKTRGELGKRCEEMMGRGRMGGMMGSSTMPWVGDDHMRGMMGSTTMPRPGQMPWMMGSSTMPHPDGMPGMMGGMSDSEHGGGPRPPLPLIPMPGQQH